MWADREDMKDVHAWLRKIRTPRYLQDGGTLFSPPAKPRQAQVPVDTKGRVVIPASFREALNIKVGDEVELRIEDNELRVSTLKTRLARAQQRLRRFIKPGRSLAAELIAERRVAARDE
jgi:AbrB family looped-hinge helix DNA binding protein